ncbi:tRNA (guanine46-N7-)-methyltransferase [hydrothermal vent metagenome]|uniref:tRNA (guanine(46)-N(7))-methyltransferase n=1 Tax=hydrothermal vent metagenome TaxID=652676 RepID=A0A3B1E7M5_9ZZZZ
MPHLLISKHKDITTPINCDDVSFSFIARSNKENKILVECQNKQFFLTIKNTNTNILVKIDNTTRVSPVSILKKALNAYSKICRANILFTNINNTTSKIEPKQEFLKDITYFVNDFKICKNIFIEIGFGSGKHLIYQALQNPDKLIIGLEIHTPSIEQMLKQVRIKGITNILAINYDARLFLEFIDSNSIDKIFVHFPVPWDKKPHRRVMSDDFITQSLRALKINGKLELRTDSLNYFNYVVNLLAKFKKFPVQILKNKDIEINSKYETRWKKQGKNIWDIIISSTIKDETLTINNDFSFDININIAKLSLIKKTIIKNNYLVNFENIFKIDDQHNIIQLTMGSFNKPISKYIIIKHNNASYFQGDPIPTNENLKAHKLVKKYLSGDIK